MLPRPWSILPQCLVEQNYKLRWAGAKHSADKSLSVVIELHTIHVHSCPYPPDSTLRGGKLEDNVCAVIIDSCEGSIFFFFFCVIALTLFPLMLESTKRRAVYNPQGLMCQLGYDQDVVILSGDYSTSTASVAPTRFISYGMGQILVSRKKFC